jgi:hypothetical protein
MVASRDDLKPDRLVKSRRARMLRNARMSMRRNDISGGNVLIATKTSLDGERTPPGDTGMCACGGKPDIAI